MAAIETEEVIEIEERQELVVSVQEQIEINSDENPEKAALPGPMEINIKRSKLDQHQIPSSSSSSSSSSDSDNMQTRTAKWSWTSNYYSRTRFSKDQDPHDLHDRFVRTHKSHYDDAISEIKRGRKCSCWSWYILPTAPWIVNGIERGSWTNREYSLRTDEQARAYLSLKPTDAIAQGVDLRKNYLEIITEIGNQVKRGIPVRSLMGALDDPKMRSSVKYFERISFEMNDTELNAACRRTMKIIGEKPERKKSPSDEKKKGKKKTSVTTKISKTTTIVKKTVLKTAATDQTTAKKRPNPLAFQKAEDDDEENDDENEEEATSNSSDSCSNARCQTSSSYDSDSESESENSSADSLRQNRNSGPEDTNDNQSTDSEMDQE